MDNFKITLKNIQHINNLEYEFDLTLNKLHCIVGKNSVGKTTLIKAIQNFKDTNTIDKLSRINIIKDDSSIVYEIGNKNETFVPKLIEGKYILDTSSSYLRNYINSIHTELPMPNDIRTKVYQKFKEDYKSEKAGSDTYKIQSAFVLKEFSNTPKELIAILNNIYSTNKFDNIEEIKIGKKIYYIQNFDNYYLREDDFSSGEYMIVQIYKLIQNKTKMIVIDELDISLDSSAQVKFIEVLQSLCTKYEINIIFTTHSLAIMKKLDEICEDLLYMDNNNGDVSLITRSYNFIRAELFQLNTYSKVILTEDKMLESYINYILPNNINSNYKIIYIGGAGNTIDLMIRNRNNNFNLFNKAEVITILDGDKRDEYNDTDIILLPFESIEKYLYNEYIEENIFKDNIIDTNSIEKAKTLKKKASALYHDVTGKKYITQTDIFDYINNQKQNEVKEFTDIIVQFLNN